MNLSRNGRPLRVCVCTSLAAAAEPRAPRHAATLAALPEVGSVVLVDCAPVGADRRPVQALMGQEKLTWVTHAFATRTAAPVRLAAQRLRQQMERWCFQATGRVAAGALSTRAYGLERALSRAAADVYLAHNIETLLPAARAAQRRGALLMFDSMEFHSDMGDGQTAVERALVQAVEREWLPRSALVLASSDQVADALVAEYGIARPVALYNTPPRVAALPPRTVGTFALYWRNAVVGLGQRGLEDALLALQKLPAEIELHLQGRLPEDGGQALRARIAELGLGERVGIHPPYAPEAAVPEAARHTVGLCLERRGVRNHDLTVSNKLFDYHMAGLAVIVSDLPGLRSVVERSGGGMWFEPGSVEDLAAKIRLLYEDEALLRRLAAQAREFALREGNREREMEKFTVAFMDALAGQKRN
ncbi:MAG: hypothetical protein RL514_2284 [Verrucomicrobiota bacterium]|jgi:glycosyltransferase involved in cell wall biosynthesis